MCSLAKWADDNSDPNTGYDHRLSCVVPHQLWRYKEVQMMAEDDFEVSPTSKFKKSQYLLSTCYPPAFMVYLTWFLQHSYETIMVIIPIYVGGNEAPTGNYLFKVSLPAKVCVRLQTKLYDTTHFSPLTTGGGASHEQLCFTHPQSKGVRCSTRGTVLYKTCIYPYILV